MVTLHRLSGHLPFKNVWLAAISTHARTHARARTRTHKHTNTNTTRTQHTRTTHTHARARTHTHQPAHGLVGTSSLEEGEIRDAGKM